MFKLFNQSPARHDVYMRINESSTFPIKFCPTRWVENEPVTERGIDVLDNVKAVIEYYAREPPSKRPKDNNSYKTLVENQTDLLMKVKMCVFKDLSHKMNTFLTLFQSDAPMVPFLSDTLERLLRRSMGYFVTTPALEKAATALALVKLDVTVTGGNCLLTSDIKLPTASKSLFKKVKLTIDQKEIFLKEYRSFMIGIVSKFQERSPLRYAIVSNASSLNPTNMGNEGEASKIKFGGLIDLLFEHKRLTNNEGAENQYEDFLATVVGVNKDNFREFEFTTARIDDFFSFYMWQKKL